MSEVSGLGGTSQHKVCVGQVDVKGKRDYQISGETARQRPDIWWFLVGADGIERRLVVAIRRGATLELENPQGFLSNGDGKCTRMTAVDEEPICNDNEH